MIHLSPLISKVTAEPRIPSAPSSFPQLLQEITVTWQHQPLLLLTGETGSGKTYLAKRLLFSIPPYRQEFLELNCRCEPLEIEQLLFLPVPVNSTEVDPSPTDRNWSIMLLHEIDALSIPQQQRLLKRFEKLDQFSPHLQERWILTSRTDLKQAVVDNRFREDLYYRICMFRYELPPLRQRYSEILLFTRQFVKDYASRYEKKIDRIEESFLRQLFDYSWPGNIRELQHVIERAVIYCNQESLTHEHLPADIRQPVSLSSPKPSVSGNSTQVDSSQSESAPSPQTFPSSKNTPAAFLETGELAEETLENRVAGIERAEIEQALQRNLQSRTRAARELGISRVTLYNKMKKLGIVTRKTYEA